MRAVTCLLLLPGASAQINPTESPPQSYKDKIGADLWPCAVITLKVVMGVTFIAASHQPIKASVNRGARRMANVAAHRLKWHAFVVTLLVVIAVDGVYKLGHELDHAVSWVMLGLCGSEMKALSSLTVSPNADQISDDITPPDGAGPPGLEAGRP